MISNLAQGAGLAAVATTLAEPPDDLAALAKPVLDAIRAGQGFLAAALGLVLLVALARKYGKGRFPWLATDAGGTALALVAGFGATAATALAAGASLGGAAWGALAAAVAAAGGYTVLAKLFLPLVDRAAERWPLLTPLNKLLHFVLDRKTSAVKKAEAAGQAAVEAKPATGLEGVLGKPTEIE